MKPTEHNAKTPSPRTGSFATLRGLLSSNGTGAPKVSPRACALLATVALATTLACLGGSIAASPAAAQAPSPTAWWHLSFAQRPSNLRAAPVDEVQELVMEPKKVSPTGETSVAFELLVGGKPVLNSSGTPYFVTSEAQVENGLSGFPEPTAEELQKALEGEEFYGPGNVRVSGGPAPGGLEPPGTSVVRWVVTSVGKSAGAIVTPLVANSVAIGTGLKNNGGFEPIAHVAVEGRAEGQLVLTVSNLGDATVTGGCTLATPGTGKYTSSECNAEPPAPGTGSYEKSPVRITDTLPAGLRSQYMTAFAGPGPNRQPERASVTCPTSVEVGEGKPLTCTFEGQLPPFEHIELVVGVAVEDEALATSGENQLAVSGGEGFTCEPLGPGLGSFSTRACMSADGLQGGSKKWQAGAGNGCRPARSWARRRPTGSGLAGCRPSGSKITN